MAAQKLRKFTLDYNEKKERWELTNDANDRVVKSFDTKDAATKGGVLSGALGADGGSVKIQKENGRFQEERTFPPEADPPQSKG